MGFFSDFHGGGGRAEDLEDFKLTSLVGRLYKLLAEVLTNRLNKMVNKVVSKFQNVFVKGRPILNVVLIANEAIDFMLKSNNCGVLYTLGIEKTYNNVN